MTNKKTKINNNNEEELLKYFTQEELEEAAKELDDMEKHPEKYKSYNNINELLEALNNDNED